MRWGGEQHSPLLTVHSGSRQSHTQQLEAIESHLLCTLTCTCAVSILKLLSVVTSVYKPESFSVTSWSSRDPLVYPVSLLLCARPLEMDFVATLYSAILKASVLYTPLYQEKVCSSSGRLRTWRRTLPPSAACPGTGSIMSWAEVRGSQHKERDAGRERRKAITRDHCAGYKSGVGLSPHKMDSSPSLDMQVCVCLSHLRKSVKWPLFPQCPGVTSSACCPLLGVSTAAPSLCSLRHNTHSCTLRFEMTTPHDLGLYTPQIVTF